MDIVIGKTEAVRSKNRANETIKESRELPVRVLHVRPARRRMNKSLSQGQNRRSKQEFPDPVNAKVILLLVPDGHKLPPDIKTGEYQMRLSIHSEKDKAEKPDASVTAKSDIFESGGKGFSKRI